MPKEVLAKWRADNPAASVKWIRGSGVSVAQLKAAKAMYIASLSTASS